MSILYIYNYISGYIMEPTFSAALIRSIRATRNILHLREPMCIFMLFLRPRLMRSMSLHHFAKSDAKFCSEGCGPLSLYLFKSPPAPKTPVQALCSPEEPMSTAKRRGTWATA